MPDSLDALRRKIAACQICAASLPLGPRPVVQMGKDARVLIAGQAPGIRVHESGVPFDDPSGDRLRDWMGIDKATFYDESKIAILPMAFCYPGRAASGDAPPRPECAAEWRDRALAKLTRIRLTLLIGAYAQEWHLGRRGSVTETVRDWRALDESLLPMPHPSPRNNIWLKKNPWFEEELVPQLRQRVGTALSEAGD